MFIRVLLLKTFKEATKGYPRYQGDGVRQLQIVDIYNVMRKSAILYKDRSRFESIADFSNAILNWCLETFNS